MMFLLFCKLVFSSFLVLSLTSTREVAFGANFSLPADEVQALVDIAKTLEKKDWNFSVDPCSGEMGWSTVNSALGFENSVTCNCSISNDSLCHVVSIVLKAQSLPGKLPPQLPRFRYLSEIVLVRNCLTGTLPPEWGSMPLVKIDLAGNRISGSIPKEFANISTLRSLTISYNELSGSIPPELGNLPNLERINLISNYLSGKLPDRLGDLSTLMDLRISDNNFSGSIPDYIQNWTRLKILHMHGSGLSGPIPSGIGTLVDLTELRITDLINGTAQPFPPLQNLKKLEALVLRNCNITDKLPDYLPEITSFLVIDLSFNKLNGPLPSSYASLATVNYFYLTENLLTGPVPNWVLDSGYNMDLSYNNFTDGGSTMLGCQKQTVNLFGNTFKGNNSNRLSCLRNFLCPKSWYSLHINCGGKKVIVNGNTTYEDDTTAVGPSTFFQSTTNWAFSNTGHFMDDNRPIDSYTWTNKTRLSPNISELYLDARLSPLSLTYYGFCLGNGNYTLSLHFAEIIFSDDKTYNSLGRRIFDVYVQGKLILKDFNIAAEAGGIGLAIVRKFHTIVTDNTLEIRFYWAGKGTNGIPYRGVYGPLISAISVDPDFIPPPESGSTTLSVGVIVGIVAAVVSLILLILGVLWWKGCIGQRNTMSQADFENSVADQYQQWTSNGNQSGPATDHWENS